MPDVTFAAIEEMDAIYDGIARRARAALGVTAWGMQVMTLPPNWDDYPNHSHNLSTEEAGQEEVYIPLEGAATLLADEERYELRPGVMGLPSSPRCSCSHPSSGPSSSSAMRSTGAPGR
jgi:uncharacterized cupin superfamily protein